MIHSKVQFIFLLGKVSDFLIRITMVSKNKTPLSSLEERLVANTWERI